MTVTPANAPRTAPPADYQLLLPEGWFRLSIDPERRERSVDALLERQFDGIDNAPHIRREVRGALLEQATAAFQDGGIELYISLQQAGPLTIPASLLVTLVPMPSGVRMPTVQELARSLSDENPEREVTVVELAAGTAVRVRRLMGGPDHPAPAGASGDAGQTLPSVTSDYQLPVPATEAHLLLTFSSPLVQIADAMLELFDAVAGSLKWMDGEGAHE
ncbi:hypothetical protein [Streptomyces sp. NPDC048200]|uniref:hypothetical protein n=1 Tax=Streptomyces sp. NPDC048200 TaxID=3365512 RepID=UPI003721F317